MAHTVSVALASYNGAAHIGEQLASIAAQTRPPDELVVADDRSADDTVALVRRFAARAPFPVRIVEHPANLGILENFYAAFAACAGDVLVYCDQDDVWRPDKLARQLAAVERGAALCMHPSAIVDAQLRPLGRVEPVNRRTGPIAAPVDAGAVGGFGHQMMFRRGVLEAMTALRPVAERLSSIEIWRSFDRYTPFCASLVGGIAILPDPLVQFRRHGGATSGAGLAPAPDAGRRARVRTKIAAAATEAREAAAMVEVAAALGIGDGAVTGRLLRALRRKARLAERQAAILDAASPFARAAAAMPALWSSARPLGFGNEARLRAAAFSAAALIA